MGIIQSEELYKCISESDKSWHSRETKCR